jgi:hypothetical protein
VRSCRAFPVGSETIGLRRVRFRLLARPGFAGRGWFVRRVLIEGFTFEMILLSLAYWREETIANYCCESFAVSAESAIWRCSKRSLRAPAMPFAIPRGLVWLLYLKMDGAWLHGPSNVVEIQRDLRESSVWAGRNRS